VCIAVLIGVLCNPGGELKVKHRLVKWRLRHTGGLAHVMNACFAIPKGRVTEHNLLVKVRLQSAFRCRASREW